MKVDTSQNCPVCNGQGYTAEHAMDMSCLAGEHLGCPIQIQCEACFGTGGILYSDLKSDLPF